MITYLHVSDECEQTSWQRGYKGHIVMTDKRLDRITCLIRTEFGIFILSDVYIECPIKF
jgi:hypothetical protein